MNYVEIKEKRKETSTGTKTGSWLKKGGLLVFLFFLLKGIGWLVLIGLVAAGLMNETTMQKLKEAIPLF